VTSRTRQLDLASGLVAGYGRIVAEFFDAGQSRTLPWARRPHAAALVAAMAFDAIAVGEYDRAFYGGQYTQMAPLFEHYGVQPWTPEAGGLVDFQAADHELLMMAMGLASKREITQARIRVRTAKRRSPARQRPTQPATRTAPGRRGPPPPSRRSWPTPLHRPAGLEPPAHRPGPDRPRQHRPGTARRRALEPSRGLDHLQPAHSPGTGQRSRLDHRPAGKRPRGSAGPATRR
jgi:hypothetical protein